MGTDHQLTAGTGHLAHRFDGSGVALFDLDRTIVPGSSLVHLGRALARRGLIRRTSLARGLARNAVFTRRGAGDGSASRLRDVLLALAAGLQQATMLDVVGEISADLTAAAFPAARWLVDEHLRRGDFCVIVSASPQELVDGVATALGVHRAVGTMAEVVDGRYTGRLLGPFCYGPGKLTRLRAEVGPVGGRRAAAYADSMSDLPLLRACARPVAVNPDRRLGKIAKASGWPVVRFA